MLVIEKWVGRLGNNILQVLRSIYFAEKTGHKTIKLPKHHFFNCTSIELGTFYKDSQIIYDNFFDLKNYNLAPTTKDLKEIANLYKHKFISDKFFKVDQRNLNSSMITAHLRGGDVFKFIPHPYYIQPPFFFYKKILLEIDAMNLVIQDNKNPVVKYLLNIKNIKNISSKDEINDFLSLMNCRNLALSNSTFSYSAFLLSSYIKTIFIPNYCLDLLPKGDWPDNIKIKVFDLPNYIKPGFWKNSYFQRRKMIHYTPNEN